MFDYGVVVGLGALLALVLFSVLAARADKGFWDECRRRVSCVIRQRDISIDKERSR